MTPALRPKIGLPVIPLGLLLILTAIGAIGLAFAGPLALIVLALGTITMVAGAYATAFMPGVVLGLYLLSGTYKGAIQPYLPFDISVILAGLNILQIIPVLLDRQHRHVSWAGVTLWLMVGLLTLAGVLYAPDQRLGIGQVALFWGLVILPILPAAIRVGSASRYLDQFLWTIFGMGLPMVVIGLSQLSASARLAVLGADTIEVARAALLIPIVGIAFVIRQRVRWATAATLALIPVSIIVAIASGSRGPLLIAIGMGVFASIRYFSHPKLVKWRLTGLVTAVGLGSLVLVSIAGPVLPSLSTQRFSLFADFLSRGASGNLNTAVGDTSSGERVQLFGLAITLFETHPLLGVGPEGFDVLSPHYLSPIEADVYPHNAILQFAAEYGLVGLALFLILLGLAVTRKLSRLTSITAVRVLFAFAFLNAMVSGNVFNDRELWGYLMLLALIDVRRITPADTPELVGSR